MDRLGTWTELNFWSPSSRMDARVNGQTKINMEVVKRSAVEYIAARSNSLIPLRAHQAR